MIALIDDAQLPALLSLPSPDLVTTYPSLLNAPVMPGWTRAHLDPYWRQGTIAGRTVEMRSLRNVWITEEGLVFDETGTALVKSTITQHGQSEIEHAVAAIAAIRADGSARIHTAPTLLCKKRGATNYGHWLVEMLPKAFIATRRLDIPDLAICVHAVADSLRTVMQDGLALLGIGADRIIETDARPVFFESLVIVDGLTDHGFYISPLVADMFAELRARAVPNGCNPIVVARREGSARDLANRAYLQTLSEWRDCDIVEPAALSFRDQIGAFADRSLIVGVSGAGLANVAFAASGARLVALAPATMCDTFYWLLAAACGHVYEEWRCPEQGPNRGPNQWDRDLVIRFRDYRGLIAR